MATFKKRLPSTQEAIYAFAACAFPIHVWLIINVMREIPAWLLRLNIWDMVGVVAYSQMFALIETVLVFLSVVLLGAVLPAAWFRRKFVALSTIVVFIASVWFIFLHYNTQIIDQRQLVPALIWSGSLVLFITLVSVLVLRSMRVELAIDAFVKRLAVLSFIYLFIDVLSVILVIIRNI